MVGRDHFRLMAAYNRRMNQQVFGAALELSETTLHENQGAFFKSISGTLNHILVGDLLWLDRFKYHSRRYKCLSLLSIFPAPNQLNDILYEDSTVLYNVRQRVDEIIEEWINNELREDDLERDLEYFTTKGVQSRRNFGELLSHVFNHQTHHRGQVSLMLSQRGLDIGTTDFLLDIPASVQA